jgi:hypothetical protein
MTENQAGFVSVGHSGLSGHLRRLAEARIFLKQPLFSPFSKDESERFPSRFTCGNDTNFLWSIETGERNNTDG